MKRRFFTFLIGLLGVATGLRAQPTVSAALDSSRILIGDQVHLNVYVEHTAEESILGVDYSPVENIPQLEVLGTSPWDTLQSGDAFVLQQRLTLTSFDSGYYQIPPLPVQYLRADGQPATVNTNDLALAVDVVFMPGDSTQLAPIKPIIEEPVKITDFLPHIGIALGVVLIAALIYYYFFRRKEGRERPAPPEVIRPAHEVALERLAELRAKKLWQKGEVKTFHSELTYIVREYIERRYQAPALESTTAEIMRSPQIQALDPDLYDRLLKILQLADLVKFAKAEPPPERHQQAMEEAVYFVEHTKYIPLAVEEEE